MASHYLSREASIARVRALAPRLAAEASGAWNFIPADPAWWGIPSLRELSIAWVRNDIFNNDTSRARLERAIEKAAV